MQTRQLKIGDKMYNAKQDGFDKNFLQEHLYKIVREKSAKE